MMSKEVQYGSMPQKVLDNISEMSYGGYVLFSFDEKAKPQVHAQISDCLLYTSPSPRDPKTSRMPSSA